MRFQGADKASMELGGITLLEHALGALAEVPEVVVVGDEVITSRPVGFIREDPPGGGPAAGLLAGLDGFPGLPRLVMVLAVDMPLVTTATVRRLMLSADEDGALLRRRGRTAPVPLCALPHGRAARGGTGPRGAAGPVRCAAWSPTCDWRRWLLSARRRDDVDTWDDLTRLRELLD